MNKTITINIGGVVFNIDENGYALLDKYLINLKRHFGNDAGAEEIVSDIELRIAEVFSGRTEISKGYVSEADVIDIIKSMGQPEEFEDADNAEAVTENKKQTKRIYENKLTQTNTNSVSKKFMRDSDDRVVGGVAAGIAHYFNLSVVLVRVIYFILLGVLGIGLIPYLLMWLIIPKATSTIDKLKMRGEAVNIDTIAQSNRIEAIEKAKPQTSTQFFFNSLANILSKFGSFILAFLRMFLLLFAFTGFFALVALLGSIGYAILMGSDSLFSFFIESKLSVWMSAISGMVFLAVPVLFLVFSIILLLFNRKIWNQQLALILVGFWLISVLIFGLNSWDIGEDFKVIEQTSKEIDLNVNPNSGIYLLAKEVEIKTNPLVNTNISLMSQTFKLGEDSIYLTNPKLKIEQSPDRKYHLYIDLEARAKTKEKAIERIEQIVPNVSIENNNLTLANYASFYKDNLYRVQNFNYRLQVPNNGKIRISESVLNLFTDITDELPQTEYDRMLENEN